LFRPKRKGRDEERGDIVPGKKNLARSICRGGERKDERSTRREALRIGELVRPEKKK